MLPSSSGSTQLAIGNGSNFWLSGNSNYAIKPGAGIIDCAGSCGTAGQVLSSDGANAIEWVTPSGGATPATPFAFGTVYAFTNDLCLNTAFGEGAFSNHASVTTAERNTFVGAYAGSAALTTASCNTGVGQAAFGSLTTGCNNIAIGFDTMGQTTSGSFNTAIGDGALFSTNGDRNTALGRCAGKGITTGSNNVLIGACAGCNLTVESCAVVIGNYAGAVGSDQSVAIANGAGALRLYVSPFGPWSTDGTTSSFGAQGQVLTSSGNFGGPTWTTIPKYQNSGIDTTLGSTAAGLYSSNFGPGLNSWNYVNNITVSFKAVDAVTADVFYYFYNGSMFAADAAPFTQSQLANTLIDQVAGRITVELTYDTAYQYKPQLKLTYVTGNNLVVTGNINWINLSGDYV
jgi:hypothetical protein